MARVTTASIPHMVAATRTTGRFVVGSVVVAEGSLRAYGAQVVAGADGTVAAVWERRDGADGRVQGVVLMPVPESRRKKSKTNENREGVPTLNRFPMAASDPTVQWSRRGFLRLTGVGMVAMAGTAVTGWPNAWAADAARDPEILPGDAAHAWLREVYNVVWGRTTALRRTRRGSTAISRSPCTSRLRPPRAAYAAWLAS